MTLMEQCRIWKEEKNYQKMISALEALSAEERTPELDSELAQAYCSSADTENRELFQKALKLLKPHEGYFGEDYSWNFRIAFAYFYLDREASALRYFKRALAQRPEDGDALEMISACRSRLTLPRFEKNFRQRTAEAWTEFAAGEEELRRLIDRNNRDDGGEELAALCSSLLSAAFSDVSFELGYDGQKYELILTPEGERSRLFELVYFQNHAPDFLREKWNIWVGRQPSRGFCLQYFGQEVSGQEVRVWVDAGGERENLSSVGLTLYCEKLRFLMKDNEDKVRRILSNLTDQVLGEIPSMALVRDFHVISRPKAEASVRLSDLPEYLKELGAEWNTDPQNYLDNSYIGYEAEPVEDPEADWRLDVFAGSARLPSLINEYLSGVSDVVDALDEDGAAAGFFCYPLGGFSGEDRAAKILDFRDGLEAAVMDAAGEDAVTFLGGASGLYCGYLDFIAWDLDSVLTAASEFFRKSGLEWANFHSFRRDVGAVVLLDPEDREDRDGPEEETGSLLSRENIDALQSFDEGSSGYFYKMVDYLETFVENGVKEGRFTEMQARRDLQIALWYAYGCNNIDEYEYYYRTAQWMPASEDRAAGCGMWFYRYSCALMYCGRLEEALHYAGRGAQEEPDYPWTWLQLGKLRSCFGDRDGALKAVERGLSLVPGDHEFQTLRREIESGASLEQMEYHWIDPDYDRQLQSGLDENSDAKKRAISCITVDEGGLRRVQELFQQKEWTESAPYCRFPYSVGTHEVELVFRMNEGGLSKLDPVWLKKQKERLESGAWLVRPSEVGRTGMLDTVFFGLDYQISLIYRLPDTGEYFQIFPDEEEQNSQEEEDSDVLRISNNPEDERREDSCEHSSSAAGVFAGFVLLSDCSWDKEKLIRDLREEWNLNAEEEGTQQEDILYFDSDGMTAAVTLIAAPVPEREAKINAAANYMWPEAVKTAEAHKAQLMVAVLGTDVDLLKKGRLFVKILDCCCGQKYASGVYTSGTVFEPRFYRAFAEVMKVKEDLLPIYNWIWFGLYRSEKGVCGYTYGMEAFGKPELEVVNADAQPSEIRDFLANLVSYVLEYDAVLQDGETIGFSAEDRHAISYGPGISLPDQMTLKIRFAPETERGRTF